MPSTIQLIEIAHFPSFSLTLSLRLHLYLAFSGPSTPFFAPIQVFNFNRCSSNSHYILNSHVIQLPRTSVDCNLNYFLGKLNSIQINWESHFTHTHIFFCFFPEQEYPVKLSARCQILFTWNFIFKQSISREILSILSFDNFMIYLLLFPSKKIKQCVKVNMNKTQKTTQVSF